VAENLFYLLGKPLETATPHDLYVALAYTVRDRLLQRWVNT
jgi:glycogen phosphorylase